MPRFPQARLVTFAPSLPLLRATPRPTNSRRPRPHPRPHASLAPPVSPQASPATLYIIATPIGNFQDLSPRALALLTSTTLIAAEDTRRTGLLLSVVAPSAPRGRLLSCHAHNIASRAPELVARLTAGDSVALVSDAGTPAVSDPGAEVVKAAVASGLRVVPVPGACAAVAVMSVAGMPAGCEFVVVGFLARKGRERADAMERIGKAYSGAAVVLYESPHRLVDTLRDLVDEEGRRVVLGREVTKTYEEFLYYGSVAEALQAHEGEGARVPRGEYTVVVGPRERKIGMEVERGLEDVIGEGEVNARKMVDALVEAGTPTSVVAKAVAGASDLSRKEVYAYASVVRDRLAEKV